MNKTQKFIVEIVTEDSINDDNEINEMAQNIANAIVKECDNYGITPEDSETFVRNVYVKGWYSDKQIIEHTDADFKLIKAGYNNWKENNPQDE